MPAEQKNAAATNQHHHGYLKPGSTRIHDDAKADLKESFNWGLALSSAALESEINNPLIGPSRWPPAMPSLKDSVYAFFESASACAEDLLRGFAIGAGLAPEYFIQKRERLISRG